MKTTTEQFDQDKVTAIHTMLRNLAKKGLAKPYEIFVDDMKVVPKTEDPNDFDDYDQCIGDNSDTLTIKIYATANTQRAEKYIFLLQEPKAPLPAPTLQGPPPKSMEEAIAEAIGRVRQEHTVQRLEDQLADKTEALSEAEDYIKQLERQITEERNKKLGEVASLGQLAGHAFMGIAKSNPQLLKRLPGGEALAGFLLGTDTTAALPEPTQPEEEVTFERAKPAEPANENEIRWSAFRERFESTFSPDQRSKVQTLLMACAGQPELIDVFLSLLTDSKTE